MATEDTAYGLLNNPLFGLGIGLLSGGDQGGTFAGGAQAGLRNMMMMRQQQQVSDQRTTQQQAAEMQMAEMQRKQQMMEQMRAAGSSGLLGEPAGMGVDYGMNAPPPELMNETPATGMYANPAMAPYMPAMEQMYQMDPMGTSQTMMQQAMSQQAKQGEMATKAAYDMALEQYKRGGPQVVGKGGSLYIPGQGFVSPSGGVVQPELGDVLALKKQAQPRMDSFRKVAQSGENILSNIKRQGAFSDVNTLVAAIKVLDPESVVREGEVALPINVSGLWNKVLSSIQQAQAKGFLTPMMRKDIAGSVNALLRTYESAYADVASEYDWADTEYGIDKQKIIGNPVTFPTIDDTQWDASGPAVPGAPASNPAVDAAMEKYGAL